MFAFEDMLRAWAVLSTCVLCSVVVAWFRRPSLALEAYSWYKIAVANLRIRYIIVDGITIRYAVRLPNTDADSSYWKTFTKADIRNILRLKLAVETNSVSERADENEETENDGNALESACENTELVKQSGDAANDLLTSNGTDEMSTSTGSFGADSETESRPQRSVLIFVHGFSSELSTWYGLIRALDQYETVYSVDLPGHGRSERFPREAEDLSVTGLARFLRRFIETAQLDSVRVHLIGQSLGGAVVGVYAAMYPDHVAGLTMISPAVEPPFVTEFAARLNARDYSWLLPTSLDGCAIVFEHNFANTRRAQNIPKSLRMAFLDQRMRKLQFYRTMLDALNTVESRQALHQCAGKIRAPTQLIWGCDDQITHVSACYMLQRAIGPYCVRVDLFERCGHAINEEAGSALHNRFRLFREQLLACSFSIPSPCQLENCDREERRVDGENQNRPMTMTMPMAMKSC